MYIKVIITGQESSYFELSSSQMTLGRSKDCDIRINHLDASRKHLTIFCNNNIIEIIDHNSTNGVQKDGHLLRAGIKHKVSSNDILNMGNNIQISFMLSEDETNTNIQANILDEEVLDFTLGEEKTVVNMDLSSILNSLKNKPENIKKVSPASGQEEKTPKLKVFTKDEALSSSKKPFYKGFAFVGLLILLISQKNNIMSYFEDQPTAPAITKEKEKEKEKPKTPETDQQVAENKLDKSLSYLLSMQTCQSKEEISLCNSFEEVQRPLEENEGVLQVNSDTYLILTAENSIRYYHENLKYTGEELRMLDDLLRKDKNLKVNLRRLARQNYEVFPMKFSSYKLSYVSLLDFIYTNFFANLRSSKINKVTLVMRSLGNELIYTKAFTEEQMAFIEKEKYGLSPVLKYYFISGYALPITDVLSKMTILDL